MSTVQVGGRDLVMLLIGLGEGDRLDSSLGGITRLQKYLFLLDREVGIRAGGEGFQFEPYKAGPYAPRLYDDLEFLENLGLLRSQVTAELTEEDVVELESLTFDNLLGENRPDDQEVQAADAYEERRYCLTEKGMARVRELLASPEYEPVVDGIRRVKSRYAKHSLSDLLYHVYTKYPEMATESDIREKVLRRGRSG